MNKLQSLVFAMLVCLPGFSQLLPETVIRCATVDHHLARMKNDPRIPSTEDFEKSIAAQAEAANASGANNGIIQGVIRIPVIFHVVHFGEAVGTGANIAAQQVYDQITVLNEDFRRMFGTRGFNNDERGADVEVEFVAALTDPQGNLLAEPGIHRYKGPLPAYVLDDVDILVKPATIFDPKRYLNVWTVNFAVLLLGYAQFPDPAHGLAFGVGCDTGGEETDGVVILYSSCGSREKFPDGNYISNYDLGRTATHEVGHWLGLRHIWADDDGGCDEDDYCGDTPRAANSTGGCPVGKISCGYPDMIENYMDYSYDRCMNIFTRDQAQRMRIVMTKSARRRELLSSTVHLQPVSLDAAIIDIVSPRGQLCSGSPAPQVLLRNLGQSALTSVNIHYQADAGPVSTYRWTGNLPSGDITHVTLPAMAVTDGTHVLKVYTSAPNGGTDAYTFNDQWSDEFTISGVGENLDFLENFQSGLFPPGNKWQIANEDLCESWSPVSNITGADAGTTSAVYMGYYSYDAPGSTDVLTLPLVNLNTTLDSDLEFDVAYAEYPGQSDKLEVFVSTDCGVTFQNIYNKQGAALATAGSSDVNFIPTSASQWRKETLSLNNYRGEQVLIKFVGTNDFGNNLYVDNIFVSGADPNAVTVQLKKFTASYVGSGVELRWTTASEENFDHFEVERSLDANSFIFVKSEPARKGTSAGASYRTTDTSPFNGTNYYRLRIVRKFGLNALYSQTVTTGKGSNHARVAVSEEINSHEVRSKGVYPNPSSGSFDVVFESSKAGRVEAQMIDAVGKVGTVRQGDAVEGINTLHIDAESLPKGIYILKLKLANGCVMERVVVK